jgi:hypothetical protein
LRHDQLLKDAGERAGNRQVAAVVRVVVSAAPPGYDRLFRRKLDADWRKILFCFSLKNILNKTLDVFDQ